jgi:hypothetical protein
MVAGGGWGSLASVRMLTHGGSVGRRSGSVRLDRLRLEPLLLSSEASFLSSRYPAVHGPLAGYFSNISHYIAAAHPSRRPLSERKWVRCHIALLIVASCALAKIPNEPKASRRFTKTTKRTQGPLRLRRSVYEISETGLREVKCPRLRSLLSDIMASTGQTDAPELSASVAELVFTVAYRGKEAWHSACYVVPACGTSFFDKPGTSHDSRSYGLPCWPRSRPSQIIPRSRRTFSRFSGIPRPV